MSIFWKYQAILSDIFHNEESLTSELKQYKQYQLYLQALD